MKNNSLKNLNISLTDDFKIHPELLSSMGYCLTKSSQLLKERLDSELEKFQIITAQAGLLTILDTEAPINQLDLGKMIGIDKATMVKLIDGLEEQNFVERKIDSNDRRAKHITLTKAGKKVVKFITERRRAIEDELMDDLTTKEKELIRSLLPKLLVAFLEKRKVKGMN